MATFPEEDTTTEDTTDSDGTTDETTDDSGGGLLSELQPRFEALGDILQPFAILLTAIVNGLTVWRLTKS